jgi:hypothetical protein
VFTPQGRFVRQFGSSGAGRDSSSTIRPGCRPGGNVYVADDQAETLAKFSPVGKVLWQIGGGASSDPDLNGHFSLARIEIHGRLVLVNDDQQRILYIDSSGHEVDAFSPNFPTSSTIAERARQPLMRWGTRT